MEERRIKIAAGPCRLEAVLNRSRTADLLWDALPLDESASTWGDEIYFRTPAHVKEESDAGEVVEMGDVAYWPPGHALCFFFGPTPASRGDEIRAASPVNVAGRIEGDAEVLKEVRSGERVAVEQGLRDGAAAPASDRRRELMQAPTARAASRHCLQLQPCTCSSGRRRVCTPPARHPPQVWTRSGYGRTCIRPYSEGRRTGTGS